MADHAADGTVPDSRALISSLTEQNERLSSTLREAREQILSLKADVARLNEPPSGYAVFLEAHADGSADVLSHGRRLRVTPSSLIDLAGVGAGQDVLLNESMNLIEVVGYESAGEVVTLREVMTDGARAVVLGRTDEHRVVHLAAPLRGEILRPGDSLLLDSRSGFVLERIPKSGVEELVLEEVPNIGYSDIGGLSAQIEQIRDSVELPFLHGDLYSEHELTPPRGILLYGPPGCGKTLIAKAVANSLASQMAERSGVGSGRSYFLNVKGPELLNKYVGETERLIRVIFERARERAGQGMPVVIFFDEMESLFRTRGTGVSSDVENTIVPQLLSEIDGVEALGNVIVIGASNREDMIDPAILRPGRLDVKVRIDRPDADAAREIFAKYLTASVPIHADEITRHGGVEQACSALIDQVVLDMYAETPGNRFLEVTYATGDREILYFRDFASGAMIENIVSRTKKAAIKDLLAGSGKGITSAHLESALRDEFRENEDLPNTSNPDDWARVSGRRGERIVHIRSLVHLLSTGLDERAITDVRASGPLL